MPLVKKKNFFQGYTSNFHTGRYEAKCQTKGEHSYKQIAISSATVDKKAVDNWKPKQTINQRLQRNRKQDFWVILRVFSSSEMWHCLKIPLICESSGEPRYSHRYLATDIHKLRAFN